MGLCLFPIRIRNAIMAMINTGHTSAVITTHKHRNTPSMRMIAMHISRYPWNSYRKPSPNSSYVAAVMMRKKKKVQMEIIPYILKTSTTEDGIFTPPYR